MKKTTTKLLMVVDGSNLAHRAYQKFGKLKSKQGVGTGMVYGFMRLLNTYVTRFRPTYLVVTFDTQESKQSNFRNDLLGAYKNHRKKIDMDYTDFNRQLRLTKRLLIHMNIPVIYDHKGLGFESDDYIAWCALKHQGKVIIVSGDKDFCQLIDKRIKIFSPNKERIIHPGTCKDIMGYEAHECVDYLSLVGDKSDDIPGYYLIGPVKAQQFLKQFGSIENFIKTKGEFKGIDHEILKPVYKLNKKLIDLKYSASMIKRVPIIYNNFSKLNEPKLKKLFYKYTLISLTQPDFLNTFKKLSRWSHN